jgi:hypothetical protein
VTNKEIGISRPGEVGMDRFKILVPVHDGAWQNWKRFSRALLDHVNPYTNKRYGDDPALAWLSLINEGNLVNFFADLRTIPQWNKAWNAWLAKRYPERAALAAAWGAELKGTEDPARLSVEFPEQVYASGGRARDCMAFLSATESEIAGRMIRFVRKDLGCKALLTNTNGWVNYATSQEARTLYDYVDDHFYVDHPQFLKKSWQLPSRRLLVTHLTDLQNSGIRYGEEGRQTLLAWGSLPHLVRAGGALVKLRINKADSLSVWALSTGGRRVASVPCSVSDGVLQFKATVAGDSTNGARFIYEIAER